MQLWAGFLLMTAATLLVGFFLRAMNRESEWEAAQWEKIQIGLEKGDALEAETLIQEILQRKPGHVQALLKLAELYREQHREDELMGILERLLELPPSQIDPPGEAFIREEYAEICFFRNQMTEAMLHYLMILARSKEDHSVVLSRLVWLYASQGLYQKAISVYGRIPPQSVDVATRFTAALCHVGLKNWEEVRTQLLDILADRQEEPLHCYVLGKSLMELGDRDGSANWLIQFLYRTEESSFLTLDAIGLLMRYFYTRTRYYSAQECRHWEELLIRFLKEKKLSDKQRAEIAWHRAVLGWIRWHESEPDKAQAAFDTVFEVNPEYNGVDQLTESLLRPDSTMVGKLKGYYDSWRLQNSHIFDHPRRLDVSEFFDAEAIDVEAIEASVDDSFFSGVRDIILGRARMDLKEFSMLGLKQTEVHMKRFMGTRGYRELKRIKAERTELYMAFEVKGKTGEVYYGRYYPAMTQVGEVELSELHEVQTARRYDGSIVITLGTYTTEAVRFAETNSVVLISGDDFQETYLERL